MRKSVCKGPEVEKKVFFEKQKEIFMIDAQINLGEER